MSANVREGAPSTKYELETTLPDWCALTWQASAACAMFAILFVCFSYLPVSDPGTWNAIGTGQQLVQSNAIEVLPLSEGMRHSNSGWGANFAIQWLYSVGGIEWMSMTFAVLKTFTLLIWAFLFFRFAGRWAAVAGIVPLVMATFFELDGLNGQLMGQMLLPILLLVLTSNSSKKMQLRNVSESGIRSFVTIGLLFAVWANLHESFVVGLFLMLFYAAARFLERLTTTTNAFRAFSDKEFRARIWLFEFSVLATLLNPSGISLWKNLLWWPDNPVLQAFGGWSPIVLAGWNGAFIALLWSAWFVANRNGGKLNWFFTLAAIFTTVGSACCPSYIAWFAPLIILAIAGAYGSTHTHAIAESKSTEAAKPFRFAFTLLAGLFIWLGFCCSPAGSMVLGGQPRVESQVVGKSFPLELKKFVASKSANGLIWCPVYWSDWLSVGTNSALFVNANFNQLPTIVAVDYENFYNGENWKHLADKYDFANIVVDKVRQEKLTRQIRRSPGEWKIVFENDASILLQRASL